MARTPKHINVTVSSAQLADLTLGYEARIERQRTRITLLIEFLESRNLLEEFSEWEKTQGE